MLKQGIPVFGTALHERDAYRAIFSFGGTLSDLKADLVRNIPAAIDNAREFTAEVVPCSTRLRRIHPAGRGGLMSGSQAEHLLTMLT